MPSLKSPLAAHEIKALPPETQTLVISIIDFYRERSTRLDLIDR